MASHRRPPILSEYYQLRRTTIKDLAAYIGFLAGFIGAAPFAWSFLADQLSSGSFVRGLWYFFGIVVAAGIFAGTAGLGIGYVGGVIWEQAHRHRRQTRLKERAIAEAKLASSVVAPPASAEPRLRLVTVESDPVPELEGRTLLSLRFRTKAIEMEFTGTRIDILGNASVVVMGTTTRYPETGSRDALCTLLGDRVEEVRVAAPDQLEIHFRSGSEIILERSAIAVA